MLFCKGSFFRLLQNVKPIKTILPGSKTTGTDKSTPSLEEIELEEDSMELETFLAGVDPNPSIDNEDGTDQLEKSNDEDTTSDKDVEKLCSNADKRTGNDLG